MTPEYVVGIESGSRTQVPDPLVSPETTGVYVYVCVDLGWKVRLGTTVVEVPYPK